MVVASAFLGTIQTGPYLNGFKILPFLALLLIWTRLMSWTDKDAINARLPREWLNAGNFAGMVVAGAFFFMLPVSFWVALLVFFGFMVVEAGVYLFMRKQTVGLKDLGDEFHKGMEGLFKRKGLSAKEAEAAAAAAGDVKIMSKSGSVMNAPEEGTPERAQYDAAHLVLNEAIIRNAERIELSGNMEMAAVVYSVDGVLYEGPTMDRGAAGAAVAYLKFAAGLQVTEKRKPQVGSFKVIFGKERHDIRITTKGSAAGESMILLSDLKKRQSLTLKDLGMSPEQMEAIQQSVAEGTGLAVIAAPPGQGLTTLEYAILRVHDAFLQHIRTVERAPDSELEGITQLEIPATASAAEEAKEVSLLISQEPDVAAVTLVTDGGAARDLSRYAGEPGRRVYVGLRATSAFEALRAWRKLVADDPLALKNLKLVVAGRVVRKLCQACKIGYAPDPAALKKLNFDPNVVTELYQARTTRMKDKHGHEIPCGFCADLGFSGRTGIYEVLVITDDLRAQLQKGATDAELKMAFRKQKGRYMQEAALALVQEGITSLSEVQRAMKAEGHGGSPPPQGRSGAPAPSPARPAGGGGSARAPAPRPKV